MEKYSPKFDFSKMSVINILPIYISFAEIFFLDEELAIKISINEAVELAKRYGDDSSKRLVNGILGQVVNNIEEWDKKKRM
ncbi:MAG: transcription antitermination protein NusB [Candidatus Peribacteria bacterium]|nr:transcription antitermination protein NusB [Candidatus Peribacteria bacterium]